MQNLLFVFDNKDDSLSHVFQSTKYKLRDLSLHYISTSLFYTTDINKTLNM